MYGIFRAFLVCMLVAPLLASAEDAATPKADQRQSSQTQRIQQGVQSGTLTDKEAARLEKGQARVQKIEDKIKSDGVVTKQERARLQHAENVESRHIRRQKHDRQHAPVTNP